MNEDIIRYARLIYDINILSIELDKKRNDFYYGGYSFEECYSTDLAELNGYIIELKNIMKKINLIN